MSGSGMDVLLEALATAIERGKVDRASPYPPDLRGQDGASEICQRALEASIPPEEILHRALVVGMRRIGDAFGAGRAFIPELLIAARAMKAAMEHLKPSFAAGEVTHRGTIVIGTVAGDLHDIGKSIVGMVLEGEGWNVVDLGVDVTTEGFRTAVLENPGCDVGMSALLTTTMVHMEEVVREIHGLGGRTRVFVGGAPVTAEFGSKIGADGYFPDPHGFTRHLDAGT